MPYFCNCWLPRLIITNNQFQFDSLCIFFSFFFSSTRSNSPGIINPRDGITYSDVAFSALSHGGRYIVDFSLLASQIGNFNWIFRLSMYPSSTDMACIPSIFLKTSEMFFGESWHQSSFSKIVAKLLRMIKIGQKILLWCMNWLVSKQQLFCWNRFCL